MKAKRFFGWRPDLPDHRDKPYAAKMKAEAPKALPEHVDLRKACPKVYDQGQLGSCTANALAGAYQYNRRKQKQDDFVPSRLFIYYNERVLEGTVTSDAGAYIRDGIKVLGKYGAPPEELWAYDIGKFANEPPPAAFAVGKYFQAVQYFRVNHTKISEIRGCLAAGFPIVFGFSVYSSIEKAAKSGDIPMPSLKDTLEGGHAVLAVGYDHGEKRIIFRNSWGTGWGDKGYGTLPYDYVANENLADDFWTVRFVE
jgi:C1A family cysteine protease